LSINKQLDNFRKSLKKEVFKTEIEDLRKLRFALMKSPDKLTTEEYLTIHKAFSLSRELEEFYNLRVELKALFDMKIQRKKAAELLEKWIEKAKLVSNKYLNEFLKTLKNWKDKILNFFNLRISNGIVEGKNNKIKVIKRRAYGYLNFENFRLRIINEC